MDRILNANVMKNGKVVDVTAFIKAGWQPVIVSVPGGQLATAGDYLVAFRRGTEKMDVTSTYLH